MSYLKYLKFSYEIDRAVQGVRLIRLKAVKISTTKHFFTRENTSWYVNTTISYVVCEKEQRIGKNLFEWK